MTLPSARLLGALTFALLFSFASTALCAAVATQDPEVPENMMSIAFDLEQNSLTGTSRINLPPRTPLLLACGPLAISSALLERSGQPPMILLPSAANTIRVAAAAESQTLYISWTLSVRAGGEGDNLISNAGITLAGQWHPLPDIAMRYRLQARLPRSFTAVSETVATELTPDGNGLDHYGASFPHPVRNIHFVAGPYTVKELTLKSGVVLSTYFFQEDSGLADEFLAKGAAYLERYEEMIGPYPYPRYSIVENRLPTGYGMPTFTLLGQAVVRLPFIKETSLGHEILHSWFGNSVWLSDEGGNWCEGLTAYLADHLYAEDRGEGGRHRKEQLQRYGAYVLKDNTLALKDFVSASDSQPMARQVRAVGYDKGSMLFHMLRRRLGDEKFFQGLQHFYQANRFREAGWPNLEESFNSVAGEDLRLFFDQWLTRTDTVKFLIDAVDVSQKEGHSVITFTVRQLSAESYVFDLPVLITTRTGDVRQTIRISEKSEEVRVTVDDLPEAMALDPDYDLMRDLRPEEEAPTWSRFMGAGRKTVVLPDEAMLPIYGPLLDLLKEMGGETVAADELETKDLLEGSYIFLGSSPQRLGLFADAGQSGEGFTLDVRKNPLAPGQVMVLATSADTAETAAVVRKLSHYGKYSYLAFAGGRIREQRIADTADGLRIDLFSGPAGFRVADTRSFAEIVSDLQQQRVVYVGEIHIDMGMHILQLQIIQALFRENPNLAIGMEMFPRSAQKVLDGYINGDIATEREFLKEVNYFSVWGFDYRLYREIIGYARHHRIPLIGLNIDKRVVDQVFKEGGTDALDAEELAQVPAERNLDLPGYRERLLQAFAGHSRQGFDREKLPGFIQSQALWDEAMAETIADYLRAHPERRMVVIAGNGHVYGDTGIPPRVARRLDVPQRVVSGISYGTTGLETGSSLDYLLYTPTIELPPAPKIGVVLDVEGGEEDPAAARVRVRQISPDSKAGESGLKEKDIIVAVEGQAAHDINDIRIGLLDKKAGDKAALKVLREHDLLPDEELELAVELIAPPEMGGVHAMPPSPPKK